MEAPSLHEVPLAGGPLDQADTVEYHIFLDRLESTEPRAIELELLAWIELIRSEIEQFTKQYIWQREPFQLKLYSEAKNQRQKFRKEPHLYGKTNFGDNIEDEWFIVWLLLDISKRFPAMSISVSDSDGQFLLIEAAYVLPRWLKPENSEDRVWLRNGRVHILPRPSPQHPTLPQSLDLASALSILRSGTVATRADEKVQRAVQDRLQGLPQRALAATHSATCLLPLPVAHALQREPRLVAPAVDAFYNRDVDGMRLLSRMQHYSPRGHPVVPLRVRFTHCLFAQLSKQRFPPPPAFSLPPPSSSSFKAADLGMKLTCGFELLRTQAASTSTALLPTVEEGLATYDFAADPDWPVYRRLLLREKLANLKEGENKEKGKEEAEDKNEKEKEEERERAARRAFLEGVRAKQFRRPQPPQTLLRIEAEKPPPRVEDFPPPTELDDSERWLEVSPEEVDDLLARKHKEMDEFEQHPTKERTTAAQTDRMREVVTGVKGFVSASSGLDGAQAPARPKENETERTDTAQTPAKPQPQDQTAPVQFDPEKFFSSLKQTLGYDQVDDDERREPAEQEGSSDEEEDDEMEAGSEEEEGDETDEAIPESELAEFREYLQAMDRELQGTTMGETFERAPPPQGKPATEAKPPPAPQSAESEEELRPIDLDLNLVKNLLESVSGQQGMAGPFTAMLADLERAAGNKRAAKK